MFSRLVPFFFLFFFCLFLSFHDFPFHFLRFRTPTVLHFSSHFPFPSAHPSAVCTSLVSQRHLAVFLSFIRPPQQLSSSPFLSHF
ncbi:hypothetical protein DFJ73DRAFT_865104 [Zopfochytrium polystomum]|nr:hypothetical protein DFJ73DRAFT_865104 [Zopfochytrium polystomum]